MRLCEIKKAVALRPENGDAWAILGSTLKQDSRLPEAAEALKKAIPLLPGAAGSAGDAGGRAGRGSRESCHAGGDAEGAGDAQKAAELRTQMKGLARAKRRSCAERERS